MIHLASLRAFVADVRDAARGTRRRRPEFNRPMTRDDLFTLWGIRR